MTVPTPYLDRHCRRRGCKCTHTAPCDHGWIEHVDANGQETGKTTPCSTCRPELAEIILLAADPMDRQLRLAAHREDPSGLGDGAAWR